MKKENMTYEEAFTLGVAAGIGAYALYKVCENKFSTPDKP